jgi:hypothetical protein
MIHTAAHHDKTLELARYVTEQDHVRVLIGRRVDGDVHIYDAALGPPGGRSYFVEAGFESKAELAMLVRDYLREVERLGCCPMSSEAVRLIAEGSLGEAGS